MPCTHPLASLKSESASTSTNGTITVRFACTSCGAPITKQFMGQTPEPRPPAGAGIRDLGLLEMPPVVPEPTRKVRRGANSPWRKYNAVTPTKWSICQPSPERNCNFAYKSSHVVDGFTKMFVHAPPNAATAPASSLASPVSQ
jgi:hypothetical protein